MKYGPLIFLSIIAIVIAIFTVSSCHYNTGDPLAGKRIYEEGILANGDPLVGYHDGSKALEGALVSCARCHRKSGYGSIEGNVYVPPITADILFNNRLVESRDMLRSLFQEEYTPNDWAKIRNLSERPAYNDESLQTLLATGINALHQKIEGTMPRYQLDETNFRHLSSYLKIIGEDQAVGISKDTIHFATAIAGYVSDEERLIFKNTVETYVNWKNKNVIAQLKAAKRVPHHKGAFVKTYKMWKIHFWELNGTEDSYMPQLERKLKSQPIFAMISGLSDIAWDQIHLFAEQNEIPSIFPNTSIPNEIEEPYNLYLSRGVYEEASVMAEHLVRKNQPVVFVRGKDLSNRIFVDRIYELCSLKLEEEYLHVLDVQDLESSESELQELLPPTEDSINLVLATNLEEIEKVGLSNNLKRKVTLYTSSNLCDAPIRHFENFMHFCSFPFTDPETRIPRNFRVHAWMRSRGLSVEDEQLQLNTYFALSITDFAVDHMAGYYSRQYLIERIEHETENNLNPGIYPSLSLGPGQRFASKNCSIIKRPGRITPVL